MNSKLLHQRLTIDACKRAIACVSLMAFMLTGIVSPNVFSDLRSLISVPAAEAAVGINPIIHYQGKISLLAGSAVGNGTYNMRFKIYDALSGGNLLWSETWSNATTRVTMTGGLFSVGLGTHVTMTGSVNFNTDNLYLQVEFDPGNDGVYEEVFSPRRRFASVPYAHNTDTIDGIDSTTFLRKDAVNVMTGSIISRSTISGSYLHASTSLTTSGSLTVKGVVRLKNYTTCAIITTDSTGNLGCGTSVNASTGSVIAIADGKYVKKSGDTMTGTLVINPLSGNAITARGTISGALITQNGAGSNYFMGNLGIGTTTPLAPLYIKSSLANVDALHITDAVNYTLTAGYGGTGVGSFGGLAGTSLALRSNNVEALRIILNGNIGIGATNPGSKLSVSGAVIIGNNIGSAAAKAQLDVKGTISGSLITQNGLGLNSLRGNTAIGGTTSKGALTVYGSGAFTGTLSGSALNIQGGTSYVLGNLGIGTATPGVSLDVLSQTDDIDVRLTSNTSGISKRTVITNGSGGQFRLDIDQGVNGSARAFIVNIGAAERMRINSSGNFGLGNSAPGSRLSVSGSVIISPNGLIGSSVAGAALHVMGSVATTSATTQDVLVLDRPFNTGVSFGKRASFKIGAADATSNGAGRLDIDVNASLAGISTSTSLPNNTVMTLLGSHLVGIGTTTPGSSLAVSGAVVIGNNIGSAAAKAQLDVKGTISGSLLVLSSMNNCTLKTSATGAVICGTDLTGGGSSFGTGNVVTIGDSKYVNVGGDTMTGTLVINPASGNAITARGTISGSLITQNGAGSNYFLGKVGIGLTNPTYPLDVSLDAGSAPLARLYSTSTADGRAVMAFQTAYSTGQTYHVGIGAAGGVNLDWGIRDTTTAGSPTRFVIKATSGNIGIGNTSPGSKLSVSGAVVIGGNIAGLIAKAQLDVKGTISGALITQNGAGSNYFMGSVGIGTTSPSFALDINAGSTGAAGARITGSNYPALRIVSSDVNKGGTLRLASASTQWDMYVEAGTLRFYQGRDRMTFASGGNVGIGTVTPGSKLAVSGSVIIGNNIGSTTTKGGSQLEVLGTISGALITQNGAGNNHFMGTVGIGTTNTSSQQLVVASNANAANGITIANVNTAGGTSNLAFNNATIYGVGSSTIGRIWTDSSSTNFNIGTGQADSADASLVFWSSNSNGGYQKETMRILKNGNVGIGTSTPKGKFVVAGSGTFIGTISGSLITQNGAGSNYFMGKVGIGVTNPTYHLEVQDATNPRLMLQDTTNNLQMSIHATDSFGRVGTLTNDGMQFLTNNAIRATFDNNGSFGIGTATPKAKFVVIGSGAFTGTLSGSALNIQGTSYIRGRLGIGTISPSTQLHIVEANSASAIAYIQSTYTAASDAYAQVALKANNGTDWRLGTASDTETAYGVGGKFYLMNASSSNIALTVDSAFGLNNVGIGTTAPKAKLDVRGTMSGALLTLSSMRNCTLKTSGTGNVICGSDNTGGSGSFGTGNVVTIGDRKYVNVGGDTMTGTLVISNGKSLMVAGTISGGSLKILGAGSGSIFHAEKLISSSGTLIVKSRTAVGSGAVTIVQGAEFATGAYIYSSGSVLALDSYSWNGANKHILFGYKGNFDTNLYRSGINTLQTDGSFNVGGNISGSLLSLNGTGVTTLMNYKVGIGTTAPRGRLGVLGEIVSQRNDSTGEAGFRVFQAGGSSNVNILTVQWGNTVPLQLSHREDLDYQAFYFRDALIFNEGGSNFAGGTNLMTLSGSRVGIGTTTPRASLDVSGSISGSTLTLSRLQNCTNLGTSNTGNVLCNAGVVEKDADETISSNTTLQDDDHLQFVMEANKAYLVEIVGYYTTGATGDFKYSVTPDSNSTVRMIGQTFTAAATAGTTGHTGCNITAKTTVCTSAGTVAQDWAFQIRGIVVSSSTGGTFKLRWAQNSTDATSTVMKKNSVLRYTELAGAADLAEFYNTLDANLTPGSLVSIDPSISAGVKKSEGKDARVIGVVSTKPGIVLGETSTIGVPVAVALAGRIPVNVTDENGPIAPGDFLVPSSTPGSAMKAKGNGSVVGQALEALASGSGQILMFIKNFEQSSGFVMMQGASGSVTQLETDTQIRITSKDMDNRALMLLESRETDGRQDMLVIKTDVGSADNTVLRINASGSVFTDGVFNSAGADYAEWFRISGPMVQAGEVVCIDITKQNTVKRCADDSDSNVMGIVSTHPAFVGNVISGADGITPPGYALIGLIGQVPARVTVENNNPIHPGDALTPASIPGYARKAKAGESTVGVALEGLESGQGIVNVLISRRNSSLTVDAVEDKVLKTIADMEIEDEVQLMVSSALGDLNVDEQISNEVTKQIDAITAQNATIESITTELNALKLAFEELKNRPTGTGTTNYQLPATSGSVFGHLAASSMELDSTLVTGGNARIGGDLSIDGTLNASSLFVPNGLTIDGGVTMNGILNAQRIRIAEEATVDGTLTINGTLNLASGAHINLGSGALTMDQLIVENALFVMGDITVQGMATFLGDINVKGELTVSNKFAGFAMIPKSGTSVTIFFGSGFKATPIVSVTPQDFVYTAWRTFPVTQTGFTIELSGPTDHDIVFSWFAIGVGNPIMLNADLTDEGTIVFPTDEKGIPVSSNMTWNACIRNITMLDGEGQPLSCARYHDAYTWTHPDLNITFIWNTSVEPALLQVPAGYEARIMEESQTILNAINDQGSETGDEGSEIGDEGSTEEPTAQDEDPMTGEEPSTDTEEPVVEEAPVMEEPPAIEGTPAVEEPVTEEPVTEEPVIATPIEETPAQEQTSAPETTPETTPADEPAVEPQA